MKIEQILDKRVNFKKDRGLQKSSCQNMAEIERRQDEICWIGGLNCLSLSVRMSFFIKVHEISGFIINWVSKEILFLSQNVISGSEGIRRWKGNQVQSEVWLIYLFIVCGRLKVIILVCWRPLAARKRKRKFGGPYEVPVEMDPKMGRETYYWPQLSKRAPFPTPGRLRSGHRPNRKSPRRTGNVEVRRGAKRNFGVRLAAAYAFRPLFPTSVRLWPETETKDSAGNRKTSPSNGMHFAISAHFRPRKKANLKELEFYAYFTQLLTANPLKSFNGQEKCSLVKHNNKSKFKILSLKSSSYNFLTYQMISKNS